VRLGFDDAELELATDPTVAPTPSDGSPVASRGAIPRIVVRFFPDGESLAAAYRAGAVDTAAGLLPQHVRELASTPGTTVLRYPSTRLTTLVPNVRAGHPAFTSVDVRHGLLRALDRTTLIEGILGGAAEQADSPISPESWAYAPDSTTVYAYDPAAAAKDLQKAGWKRGTLGWTGRDGKPVQFSLATLDASTDPQGNALARAIADEWRALGIGVDVTAYDADGFVAQLVRGNFDIALLDVNMGLDPDVFPLLTSSQAVEGGSNVGGYQSGALDKLLSAARSGTDRDTRTKAFADLQAALTRDLPLLPIAFTEDLYLVDARLAGPDERLVADRSGRFWDVLTWRLADGSAAQSP
jgi:peptide/nickel transport system substrate-binding protein